MVKPPKACPLMEPISHVAELMDAALGKTFLETICAIIAEKVGPANALIAPVTAITEQMSAAIVHLLNVEFANGEARKIKAPIQIV